MNEYVTHRLRTLRPSVLPNGRVLHEICLLFYDLKANDLVDTSTPVCNHSLGQRIAVVYYDGHC